MIWGLKFRSSLFLKACGVLGAEPLEGVNYKPRKYPKRVNEMATVFVGEGLASHDNWAERKPCACLHKHLIDRLRGFLPLWGKENSSSLKPFR